MKPNWNEIDNSLEYLILDRQGQLAAIYSSSLKNVKAQMASLYEKHGTLTYKEMIKYNRMKELDAQLTKELIGMGKKVKSVARESIKTGLEDSYYKTGFFMESHTGLNLGFTKLPTEQVNAVLDDPFDWPTRVSSNVAKLKMQLKDVIIKGLIQGVSYPTMAASLSKRMKIGADASMRLLRTEVHRAQVEGRLHGFTKTESAAERLGVKTERSWRRTGDDRVRDSHNAMAGQVANKEGMFTLPSGIKTKGPGLSGDPNEDINCRCTVRLIFKDYEPNVEEATAMNSGQGFSCLMKNG